MVPAAFPNNTVVAAGCLSALVALVAAALQVPFQRIAASFGKAPVMAVGLSAFGGFGALCLSVKDEAQLAAYLPLVMCYVLHGVGRACFEGINKALYADFFKSHTEAAFANIVLANGVASAAAYFAFPELGRQLMATFALVSAIVAISCYAFAEILHRRESLLRVR